MHIFPFFFFLNSYTNNQKRGKVCVNVWARGRESVCVCVCMCEIEKEQEGEKEIKLGVNVCV